MFTVVWVNETSVSSLWCAEILFAPLFMHKVSNHFDENDRAEVPIAHLHLAPFVVPPPKTSRKKKKTLSAERFLHCIHTYSVVDVTSAPIARQKVCKKVLLNANSVPDGREVGFFSLVFKSERPLSFFSFLFSTSMKPVLANKVPSYRCSTWPSASADAVISKSHKKFTLTE